MDEDKKQGEEKEDQINFTKNQLTEVVKESVESVVGEKMATMLPEMIDKSLKDKGIDSDAISRMATEKIEQIDSKKEAAKHGLTEKSVEFLKAVFMGNESKVRDLSEGTDSEGGYLVPTDLRGVVATKIRDRAVFRRAGALVLPMSTDKMDNPFESTQVVTYWVDENDEITQSDSVFGNEQLSVHTLAGLTRTSRQLIADSKVDIINILIQLFTDAIAREEDDKFMVGTGSGQPKGLRAYSGIGSVAQSGSSLSYDDLVELMMEVPEGYRNDPTAGFIANKTAIKLIMKLKDSANMPIFGPGNIAEKRPSTLMGYPLYELNAIPSNLGAGSNTTEIYFGAFRFYLIGDREQVGVETSTQEGDSFKKHRMAVKIWERVDGKLGLEEAWAKLTGVK